MKDWEKGLSPLVRDRLARIGEATPDEKQRNRDVEELNSTLAQFFKGSLQSDALLEKLKEYEKQGKQFILKEARSRLKTAIRERKLPIKFEEESDGTLTVDLLKEDEMEAPLVLELTDANFDDTVQQSQTLVVDCWAPWCGPCRMVAPIIEELASDYKGKITFGKLNVDDNPSISARYRIMSIPTLLIFKNGQLADQKVGAMPKRMLEAELLKHL